MKKLFAHIFLFISIGIAVSAASLEVRITDERLTLHADRVPLQDILQRIADTGVQVRVDPQLNPVISASFENRELQGGLESIFRNLNHVLVWEPVEPLPGSRTKKRFRLAEIQVFRPGRKDLMRPMAPAAAPKDTKTIMTAARTVEPGKETVETKVVIKQNKVFVPVILGYGGNETNAMLIFDTGADSILLHRDTADRLDIRELAEGRATGLGGVKMNAGYTKLDYVKVGPLKKENLTAAVIDFNGTPADHYNGLLGMNFLKGLKYIIDFDRQVIVWTIDHEADGEKQ